MSFYGNTIKFIQLLYLKKIISIGKSYILKIADSNMIYILGVKGGIGKTTFSIYFAKHLSSLGKKVLYIDCDYLSFGSLILGHKNIGLVREIENRLPPLSRSLEYISSFYVLKLFTDPLDSSKIYRLEEKIYNAFEKIKDDLDIEYIILDSTVGLMPDDIIIKSLEKLSILEKGVYLTDIGSLNATIRYAKMWSNLQYKALVVNMIPPIPEELSEAISIVKNVYSYNMFNTIAIVPFDEELYNYNPSKEIQNKRLNLILLSMLNNSDNIIIN